jgi:NitT/TauT family transport system permease protein
VIAGLAALAWLGGAVLTQWWPNLDDWPNTNEFIVLKLALAVVAALLGIAGWRKRASDTGDTGDVSDSDRPSRIDTWLGAMPWLLALALVVTAPST